MTANGTETQAQAETREESQETLKAPQLKLGEETYTARSLDSLSWAEQIKANKLTNRLEELSELLQDYFDIDDDDDEEEAEVPEEMQEQWAKVHRRIIRFGYPDAPAAGVKQLSPSDTVIASSRFMEYMRKYDVLDREEDEQGNSKGGTKTRKSRKTSQKR